MTFTNVEIDLENPQTNTVFYHYTNAGGTLEPSESTTYYVAFRILIKDIPDTNIRVKISGNLLWQGDSSDVEKVIYVPIEWDI